MSHPYQAGIKSNEDLQQGLFPSWHNRRHCSSSDKLLGGNRKTGSFEALQEMVKDQEEKEKKEGKSKGISDKIKSIVKDTTSGPAVIQHTQRDQTEDDDGASNFIRTSD